MASRSFFVFLFVLVNAHLVMGECKPLTDEQLGELLIPASIQVLPGTALRVRTFRRECCVFEIDVNDVCATWSMDPVKGVQLNSETGEMSIDQSTQIGSTFAVKADVQNGRRILSTKVTVFTREQNPFVGMWKESAEIDCDSGKEFSPERNIREIEFQAGGEFSVTWTPFEIYRDYWGTYTFDLKKGVFTLSGLSGNYVPKDVSDGGTFAFQSDGSLLLKDFWFGTQHTGGTQVVKKACGHRLIR